MGRGMCVVVGGGAAVGASVGKASSVSVGSVAATSEVTDFRGAGTVETAVTVLVAGVSDGFDCTMDRAHILSAPKQRSSSRNGNMIRAARLRFERRCGVGDGSSIGAAF